VAGRGGTGFREIGLQVAQHRSLDFKTEIPVVLRRHPVIVFIGPVRTSDHGRGAVGDHQLAVVAPLPQPPGQSPADRMVEPQFQSRSPEHPDGVPAAQVVDHPVHPDPARLGCQHAVQQVPPGGVVRPLVDLEVDRGLGPVDEGPEGLEDVAAGAQEPDRVAFGDGQAVALAEALQLLPQALDTPAQGKRGCSDHVSKHACNHPGKPAAFVSGRPGLALPRNEPGVPST